MQLMRVSRLPANGSGACTLAAWALCAFCVTLLTLTLAQAPRLFMQCGSSSRLCTDELCVYLYRHMLQRLFAETKLCFGDSERPSMICKLTEVGGGAGAG